MKIINSAIYCEDYPHRLFINLIIPQLLTYNNLNNILDININNDIYTKKKGKNKLKDELVKDCKYGFNLYNLDLIFIVSDGDSFQDDDISRFREELTIEIQKLKNDNQKLLIIIPVQCIEHWLWYLKYNLENPSSNKNIKLETEPRNKAKLNVYSSVDYDDYSIKPIIETLLKDVNINWIITHSNSFNIFVNEFKHFCQQLIEIEK